jgi:hypothetical protein
LDLTKEKKERFSARNRIEEREKKPILAYIFKLNNAHFAQLGDARINRLGLKVDLAKSHFFAPKQGTTTRMSAHPPNARLLSNTQKRVSISKKEI